MLIKEYRILLPLSVDEWRIGMLYMLLRKSRESHVDGNEVEMLKNELYSGPEGTGQYTLKIIHVGNQIPNWCKNLAPEEAFNLQEESWNLYPYVHTFSTSGFTDKYKMELKSKFIADNGTSENVFNLPPSELKSRQVVFIDVTNPAGLNNLKPEEDPRVFRSQKTGRGPLKPNWMDDPSTPVMCCYKLAKVELKYWGLQSRAERLIHELGLEKTFRLTNRQLWCWLDEWIDLNLADIRRLEAETADYLKKLVSGELESVPAIQMHTGATNASVLESEPAAPAVVVAPEKKRISRRLSRKLTRSLTQTYFLDSLRIDDDDDDDEFYDAVGGPMMEVKEVEDDSKLHPQEGNMTTSDSYESSLESSGDYPNQGYEDLCTLYWDSPQCPSELVFHSERQPERGHTSLLLVVHGGSYICTGADAYFKEHDFQIFSSKLDELRQKHFYRTQHQVITRLVTCPFICTRALACMGILRSCPEMPQNPLGSRLSLNSSLYSADLEEKLTNFALGAIPLLVRSDKRYVEHLTAVINELNSTYEEFITSTEDFSGHISIVSDCVGSIITFDILSQFSNELPLLKFSPHQFFMLGSPVGIVLAQEKLMGTGEQSPIPRPNCDQLYNIYYEGDPLSFRIEPLLDLQARFLAPITIHKYNKLPLGDGCSLLLQDYVREDRGDRVSEKEFSLADAVSVGVAADKMSVSSWESLVSKWWGAERVDFSVKSPYLVGAEEFQNFTTARILYSRYWEANEILSFILRSCLSFSEHRQNSLSSNTSLSVPSDKMGLTRGLSSPSTDSSSSKNVHKTNTIKYFTLATNFRGIDVVVSEGQPQVLHGKFSFGKLDIASLSRESVELFYQDAERGWGLLDTASTDGHGHLKYEVPAEKKFPVGIHPIHLLISGNTSTVAHLAVLPENQTVDAVVFSIDGSFHLNFSVKGNKSKVRPGSVEIVEFWKNLGYLIFYVTARPDMQKYDIMQWFEEKKFPTGLTHFNDGVTKDLQAHKATYLRHLIQDLGIRFCAAYGSAKEAETYRDAGIPQNCIYSLGKKGKSPEGNQPIGEHFSGHIQDLKMAPPPLAKTSVIFTM